MEEKERKEKSDKLFDKGMECYNKQQYKEALKYFEASIKFSKNDRAELFIGVCKNNIPEEDKNNNNNSNNNYHKSYSYSGASSSNYSYQKSASTSSSSSTNFSNNKTKSSDNVGNDSDDKKCKELLKKKDYYDILNLKKDATQDEIKRGYKKQAVRFHPDKNHSKLAEECFKKISEAYQCLSDPEKKAFYDKYGNEQEFKEKYYQATHRYYQEEMDPFEAFNIFFGNGFYPNGRRYHHYHYEDDSNDGMRNRRSIIQLFPVLLLFIIYLLPSISYLFQSKPLYQFTRNNTYNHKRRTSINGVEFYVGDKFIKKYPKMKDFKFLEPTIEKEYLGYLYDDCSNMINHKNELQYYMSMTYSQSQRLYYKRKLDQLDFGSCQKYNSLVKLIR
jgi:DnaJ family protein B protein 12